jgi:hypothetical protein
MLDLYDLIDWLQYGKESGYVAARCSKIQEEHWATLLAEKLFAQERWTVGKEYAGETPVRDLQPHDIDD